jgi:hypothetical protein
MSSMANTKHETRNEAVQSQIELPFLIAFGIVMQGFRIRLGRSFITIAGVVLGVAFIMANVTNQIARTATREEESMRSAARRMTSFLVAETGPVSGKTFGVVQTEPLTPTDRRFIADLLRNGLTQVKLSSTELSTARETGFGPAVQNVTLDQCAKEVRALLLLGNGPINAAVSGVLGAVVPETIVATTASSAQTLPPAISARTIRLERDPTPEQIEKAAKEKRKNWFRSIWIICISVLVTVMSISNAILMSVTERFREIGTMKCLGAKSSFIRRLFLIESSIIGLVGGVAGALSGALFSLTINGIVYGFAMMYSMNYLHLFLAAVGAVIGGGVLSIIAALNPANVAASMTPSHALRSNV